MRYLKTYQKHNEGLKSTIAGIGLAGSLLTGTPDVKASSPIEMTKMNQMDTDGTKVQKMVTKLSEMRTQNCQDSTLNQILDEIKVNVNNTDSAKLTEMFGKLSNHIQSEYGYTIPTQDLKQANVEEIKSKEPSESSFYYVMGWLGSLCLAICGVPQAMQSYKDKHSHGISWGMLLLWAFGEVFALAYVFNKLDMPMMMNYSINIFVIGMMLYYKINPTGTEVNTTVDYPNNEPPSS